MRIALVILCAATAIAHADKAVGEAAFEQGKELMKAGKLGEACAAFEKSQAADPELGTEYNLALCDQAAGRFASAWALYRELAQRDTNRARRADSDARATALAPRLIELLITVTAPVDGLVITRNDEDVTSSVGIASPIDPGAYHIVVRAEGFEPWSIDVTASQEGGTVHVAVPALVAVPAAPSTQTPEPVVDVQEDAPVVPSPSSGRRRLGLWGAGAGAALAAIGVGLGWAASRSWDRATVLCGGDASHCTATGDAFTAADDAQKRSALYGDISTVTIGLGAVAVVTGAVLYLTAPHAHVVASASRDSVALTAMGAF